MLTARIKKISCRLRGQRGFTLVELLVAMTAGIVVMMAGLTVLDLALKQTTNSFSYVDATDHARTGFESIENQLHSSCFADDETPIQAGSNGTSLIFLSSFGNSATPTPVWNEIDYGSGELTESTYSTSESEVSDIPVWTRGSQQSSTVILTNVWQQVVGTTTTPVFQYFAYQQAPGTDQAGNNYMVLPDGTAPIPGTTTTVDNPLAPGGSLTSAQAQSATEVVMTLVVGPAGGANERSNAAGDTVSDSVNFRLTPAANNTGEGGTFNPCQ
jgi:prepilin-type N-terminal cleavage/methylation domain-containing protein